jgi:DNA polymerase-3 subunit epsilon
MIRSVLFDTETTGLDPLQGDRVIEVAALELVGDLPTGRHFHALIHPDRDIPEEVVRVHGITLDKLVGKPRFREVADDLLAFLGDGMLVAHNAPFDFGFINAELARIGRAPLARERMVDTLVLAKTRFPGMPNSLDALCRRFAIDLSERTSHNALLDCRLLAEVYVELTGGRQRGLALVDDSTVIGQGALPAVTYAMSGARMPRLMVPSEAELAAHAAFVGRIKEAVWTAP